MALTAECHDCGAKHKFADADEGQSAVCKDCGASISIARKPAGFVATKTKSKKPKRKPTLDPAARLTEDDKKAAVRAGESGAKILLAALLANVLALVIINVNHYTRGALRPEGLVPQFVPPMLGLFSNALAMAAIFRWRKHAVAIERGTVVQIGMILGPILFAVDLARIFGLRFELVDWLSTYGRMVYITLLVVYLERVCVLGNRPDLLDLSHRVLSCGVGVIGIALIQQFIVFTGIFIFAPLMAMLSVAMMITWLVWSFEYFRLLMYAVDLRNR